MSPTLIASAIILVVASAAFLFIGNAYKWELTSPGYGFWTRFTGSAAVMGLAVAAAWSRLDRPLIAAAIVVGGAALAVGYVWLHRWLTDRLRVTDMPPVGR
jgi:biotin transporter BioY